jgi:hypothetical protein
MSHHNPLPMKFGLVSQSNHQSRIDMGSSVHSREHIIAGRSYEMKRRPGVSSNLEGARGTGAGSTAREIADITFSAKANMP